MDEFQNYSFWKNQKSLLLQATPLLLLILTSILFQNIMSILLILAMIISFDSMNQFITRLSERCKVSIWEVLWRALYLVCCTALSYTVVESVWLFMLPDMKKWSGSTKSFWLTLFQVTVLDFICKYLTIVIKCLILWICTSFNLLHIRGKILSVCEGVSQVCRCLLPIPEWTKYMILSYSLVPSIFCWLLTLFYIILKACAYRTSNLITVILMLMMFTDCLLHVQVRSLKLKLGIITKTFEYTFTVPSNLTRFWSAVFENPDYRDFRINDSTADKEIARSNHLPCPLCHKKCKYPVEIACKHTYCEACISIWCDRELKCPYCLSANVNALILGLQQTIHPPLHQFTNLKWKTGGTDSVIQLF